jgi:hypothetical protein
MNGGRVALRRSACSRSHPLARARASRAVRGRERLEFYTLGMARNLIKFSKDRHAVVDQTVTPPNWSGFLPESPWEATPAAELSSYTLTPCTQVEDQNAIATATILLTQ